MSFPDLGFSRACIRGRARLSILTETLVMLAQKSNEKSELSELYLAELQMNGTILKWQSTHVKDNCPSKYPTSITKHYFSSTNIRIEKAISESITLITYLANETTTIIMGSSLPYQTS